MDGCSVAGALPRGEGLSAACGDSRALARQPTLELQSTTSSLSPASRPPLVPGRTVQAVSAGAWTRLGWPQSERTAASTTQQPDGDNGRLPLPGGARGSMRGKAADWSAQQMAGVGRKHRTGRGAECQSSITLAGTCMGTFCRDFPDEDSIATCQELESDQWNVFAPESRLRSVLFRFGEDWGKIPTLVRLAIFGPK